MAADSVPEHKLGGGDTIVVRDFVEGIVVSDDMCYGAGSRDMIFCDDAGGFSVVV